MGLTIPKMGSIAPTMGRSTAAYMPMPQTGLANALFSGVQQRLLGLLFGQPDKSFYLSEIVRQLHSGTGAVDRELNRLEHSGLVSVQRIGNQKHYQANEQSPIYSELHGIIQKTVGLHDPLKQALSPFADQIQFAFVYGSVAKGTDSARSDIDLMIVGKDISYSDVYSHLQKAESTIGRLVNPTIMEMRDWRKRVTGKSSFVEKVVDQPKIFIIGSESDLSDERTAR
jgi:predicted nucleotidyltransferase